MKTSKILKVVLFSSVILLLLNFTLLSPANELIRKKVDLIEDEIIKKGYRPNWIVISEKRSKIYNSILSNSSKTSHHLTGKAIDVYVFDINGDGTFDKKDISIVLNANNTVEKQHPELVGSFGTYTNKGYLTKHMIHLDVSGRKHKYNY
jgi:hypothetical protein